MKLAVLVSGKGSLLEAMIEQNIPIALVLADKQCRGVAIAVEHSIPTKVIDRRQFGYQKGVGEAWDRRGFTVAVTDFLDESGIEVVAMAGFMTVFDQVMFERYGGRVLNSHPALLPQFKGATAVADALAAGVTETGSTIHVATEILDDETTILGQVKVPVLPGDDVDTLWERIKVEERQLYPQVLRQILDGSTKLNGLN